MKVFLWELKVSQSFLYEGVPMGTNKSANEIRRLYMTCSITYVRTFIYLSIPTPKRIPTFLRDNDAMPIFVFGVTCTLKTSEEWGKC